MEAVTIAELKTNLSKYLRRVRAGEEILVCDRSVPVGKLVPLTLDEGFEARELELAAAGVLRLPDALPAERGPGDRGGRISAASVLEALDADRDA
jgi:prevent-host-death family protein